MLSRILRQLTSRKGDLWLMSAKWSAPFIGLAGGLVAAKFLEPEELGVAHAVMLIPAYVGIIQLGVFSGLTRNLPLYRARGEMTKAQTFADASAKMARWVGGIGALIALLSVIFFLLRAENELYVILALFLIPLLFFGPRQLHLSAVHRSTLSFARVGKAIHLQNAWNLFASLSTSLIGVYGMALKIGGNNLVSWLALRFKAPVADQKSASWKDVSELSKVGLPVMFSGVIFGWLSVADRSVIATFMTAEDLGHFALATIAVNALKMFPASINMLLYPRIARTYGATNSSRSLRRFMWIGMGLNLVVMLPVAALGWFCIPPLVNAFLPAYSPGIEAAQIVALGAIFQVYSGVSAIIPILRKNWLPNIFGCFAVALVWLVGIYAVKQGYGITGVATVRVAVTALYGFLVIAFVYHLTGRDVTCRQ